MRNKRKNKTRGRGIGENIKRGGNKMRGYKRRGKKKKTLQRFLGEGREKDIFKEGKRKRPKVGTFERSRRRNEEKIKTEM